MSRARVLITARSFGAANDDALTLLTEQGYEVERVAEADLAAKISEADAVIAGLESYDKDLLARADKLKVISRYGVGFDAVDLEAATVKGIAVTNTPGANNESVADLAFALVMAVARNVVFMHQSAAYGAPVRPIGIEVVGKTIAVVGTGAIGKGFARRWRGFNARVLAFDLFPDEEFARENAVTYVELDELLEQADVISLHLPLNEHTHHLIDENKLALMKPTAVLINTARGELVDNRALFRALKEGRLWGAGLDVVEGEDEVVAAMSSLRNCIMTPHAGGATLEASHRMSIGAARNVIDIVEKGRSENLVPPQRGKL